MKILKQSADDERAKILAQIIKDSHKINIYTFSPSSTKHIEQESKVLSKSPSMKKLEPAITSLLNAHRVRVIRESSFEAPLIDDNDDEEYKEDKIESFKRSITAEINHRLRSIPYQIYEIGGLIHLAKYTLGHGEFDKWLEKSLSISKSSALNFMRVYETCFGRSEILDFFKRSDLYKICAPNFPDDFRELLFENITEPFNTDEKELFDIAIKWKKGEVTSESPEVQRILKTKRIQTESKFYIEELKDLKSKVIESEKRIRALNKLNDPHPFLNEKNNEKDNRFIVIGKMVQDFLIDIELKIKDLEKDQ